MTLPGSIQRGAGATTIIRIGFIRRGILARRSPGAAAAWTLASVFAFTLLRMALSPLLSGLPYVTYFPSVLIIAVMLGWRWGVVALLLCAAVANYIFVPPAFSFALGVNNIAGAFAFVLSAGLLVATAEALRTAVRELDERSQREMHLNAELQHRVKNILTVAQGLAYQTARATPEPEAFYEAFAGRMRVFTPRWPQTLMMCFSTVRPDRPRMPPMSVALLPSWTQDRHSSWRSVISRDANVRSLRGVVG
jgi:signal transduction histidine kinase